MTFQYRCDPSQHHQIHQEKNPSSSQVGQALAFKEIHIDIHREKREPDDAKCIPQNGDRECRKNQNSFAPGMSKEQVTSKNTDDKKSQSCAHPAAILSNFDAYTGKMEHKSIPHDRHSGEMEHPVRHFSRKHLQYLERLLHEYRGYGNQKEEEKERKKSNTQQFWTEQKDKPPYPAYYNSYHLQGESIRCVQAIFREVHHRTQNETCKDDWNPVKK